MFEKQIEDVWKEIDFCTPIEEWPVDDYIEDEVNRFYIKKYTNKIKKT